ncbi:MAG: TonB-dependent receptor [Tannerella sp.]|nr:TonB-dependent receptor [Tannerella sp.]
MNKIVKSKLFCKESLCLSRKIRSNIRLFSIFLISSTSIGMIYASESASATTESEVIAQVHQQNKTVKGTIIDNYGDPVIGANIVVKGTTVGTITDLDGHFSLEIPANATLVISYIGFYSQEIAYSGQSELNITLIEDTQTLDEVVVTALGVKRERKALGYAMQEVKGDQLTETRDANVANALAGKIAGVQINQSSTGVGGSTRILIRGNNSIAGNNQPLIVVDGVPIDNFSSDTDDYWGNGAIDKGSGISDINPDDIESMSVLKGPAAAALYGSRAGNGVVMITTKKGTSGKGVGITFNSNLTFENPMMTPDYQNVYGQGGEETVDGVTSVQFNNNKVGSWGPKMDGSTKEMALGSYPYAARDNDLYKDFLRTGTSWTNSLELSKASEDITFRASVSRLDNQSVVPNSGLERTSINLRSTVKLADWLSADMKINYINQQAKNRVALAADPNNIFYDYLTMPRSVGYSDWEPYRNTNWKREDGKPAAWMIDHNTAPNSPYWSTERNQNSDKRDRYIGFAAFDITFTDWLTLKLRSGIDNYTLIYDMTRATGNPYWENNGSYRVYTERFKELNTDFLFTAQKNWERFGIVGTVGGNVMYRSSSFSNEFSGELVIPDFYSISNGKEHKSEHTKSRKQINSLYATVSLSWDNFLYLDITGRNDWSSTLPKDDNSYFYPSFGGSWIFTQMLNNMGNDTGALSFGKIRASWAEVGNDTDPYMLRNYYTLNYDIKGGVFTATNKDWKANTNLKNERIQSWEVGMELKAFDNRVGLDLSYYKKNSKDQILKMSVPAATGYSYQMINAGNIENKGWEIALMATPLRDAKGFTWETLLNWSMNKNKIVELTEGVTRQVLSDGTSLQNIQIVAEVGGSYGDIYGRGYERDKNGNKIIGDDGLPVATNDMIKLGNNQPDWMLGWSNTFTFKNISLGFLIDVNYGGNVYMGSIRTGTRFGNLAMTLDGRETGIVVDGVTKSGAVNTANVSAEQYWKGVSNIAEEFVYDATSVRFRELSIGYTIPRRLLQKTPFTGIKASFVGRNLFMIYHKTKGFDPEAGFSNSSSVQGYEFASMPTMRSLGFNINVSF